MSNEYTERDVIAQGLYYANHVHAMTTEKLHSKSDIAAELAHRDIRIAELEANQRETIQVIQSNCYDGSGQSNDRLLAHANKLSRKNDADRN